MKDFVSIPTWAITRILAPFLPPAHPWHGRVFSLEDWATHQTPLCRELDLGLWISGSMAIASVILVFWKGW